MVGPLNARALYRDSFRRLANNLHLDFSQSNLIPDLKGYVIKVQGTFVKKAAPDYRQIAEQSDFDREFNGMLAEEARENARKNRP